MNCEKIRIKRCAVCGKSFRIIFGKPYGCMRSSTITEYLCHTCSPWYDKINSIALFYTGISNGKPVYTILRKAGDRDTYTFPEV